METYTIFRQIADSWVLLGMFAFFLGCILWVFRPGARAQHSEAAALIFRDEKPACGRDCDACARKSRLEVPHDNA